MNAVRVVVADDDVLLREGLASLLDRSGFEVIGISLGPDDRSDLRSRIVAGADRFHDVRTTSDRDAAVLLKELGVDIAQGIVEQKNARIGDQGARAALVPSHGDADRRCSRERGVLLVSEGLDGE